MAVQLLSTKVSLSSYWYCQECINTLGTVYSSILMWLSEELIPSMLCASASFSFTFFPLVSNSQGTILCRCLNWQHTCLVLNCSKRPLVKLANVMEVTNGNFLVILEIKNYMYDYLVEHSE